MNRVEKWFEKRGWKPFKFQKETWRAFNEGREGIVNAPTGSGKTYALLGPIIECHKEGQTGLTTIWISPIRALTREIELSATRMGKDVAPSWSYGIRTGDTPPKEKQQQKRQMPNMLITTPESLHVLFAQKNHRKHFKHVKTIVVDEWHELMGSKRGVQTELAIAHIRSMVRELKVWGVSATIGNMGDAVDVLLGNRSVKGVVIRSNIKRRTEVRSVMPGRMKGFPWAGHIGLRLLPQVVKLIKKSKTSLIFTNTRGQAEIWYQRLLEAEPDLAGQIAMHHGSISKELRNWVEDAIYDERLKAVVCTSSLDLGVDFGPVETVIQIGGPKGVARFLQRAGRSNHRPGGKGMIYFVPTNALELVESAALREASKRHFLEERIPYVRSFDVLIQFLMSLAVADGFRPGEVVDRVRSTHCYATMSDDEWAWCLEFMVSGGKSLYAYDEYKKVVVDHGVFKVTDRRIARRHRLSIGTIVGDTVMRIKYFSGGNIGTVEESFISRLRPGDVFWFAGRSLKLFKIQGMEALVKRASAEKAKVPSWQGGRMSLSSQVAQVLREKMSEAGSGVCGDKEIDKLKPVLDIQRGESHIPAQDELLIEEIESEEGHHVFIFPFEGRFVHEGIASLIAYRISLLKPISISLAYNDYGLELLSDQPIPVEQIVENNLFSTEHLMEDIQASVNANEMARRRFRDIAHISGLIFSGFPGKMKKEKHLSSSTGLLFDVFNDHDPNNLLLRQAYDEALDFQLEFHRLMKALKRISKQDIVITRPNIITPFAFPIMVDRLREMVSSENLNQQIKKMQVVYDDL